jgi:hypothetical protein
MKKYIVLLLAMFVFLAMPGCAGNTKAAQDEVQSGSVYVEKTENASTNLENQRNNEANDGKENVFVKGAKLKSTAGNQEMIATLEDNATTRALVKKLPMTLSMQNLYAREMCYHYGAGSLPTANLRSDHYEVGDIIYWPPKGSFVLLYAQNGEQFERQQIGHIDAGVEMFKQAGDVEVKFELLK